MYSTSGDSSKITSSYISQYISAKLEQYRQIYQEPEFKPFPNYPVSQIQSIKDLPVWNWPISQTHVINSISDLPVWNYHPEPLRITPYTNGQSPKTTGEYSSQGSSSNDWASKWGLQLQSTMPQQKPAEIAQQKTKEVTIPTYHGKKTTKTLTKEFVDRVKEIAQKVNCDYRDLLGVMNSESGLDPTARNRHSGAIGLLQFTGIAIKDLNQVYGMNLTKDKIANMSAMEQLDLVEKYLLRSKSFKFNSGEKLDSADLYAIVYRPAFAGKNVIATKNDGKTYSQNRGLDLDKDGMITRQDLAMAVQRKHININMVA